MYSRSIKQTEDDIDQVLKRVNELSGIKESDTGLAPPALWDLAADKQTLQSMTPIQTHLVLWFSNIYINFIQAFETFTEIQ